MTAFHFMRHCLLHKNSLMVALSPFFLLKINPSPFLSLLLGDVPDFLLLSLFPTQIISKDPAAVFILMAIHAQIFPVRAVSGIIKMVTVFMMHGQQALIFVGELPGALGAYESVDF